MPSFKHSFLGLFSLVLLASGIIAHAQIVDGTGAETFLINEADVGEFTTLQFGSIANKYLQWDKNNLRFYMNDTLRVSGNFEQEGQVFTLDADNVANPGANVDIVAAQGSDNPGTLRYNATDNEWQLSNDGAAFESINTGSGGGGGLAPYITSVVGGSLNPNASGTVVISGNNFDYNTNVSIPSWEGSIDAIRYISATEIEIDVTAGATETTYSLVLDNAGLDSTSYQSDNGVGALAVETSTWIDLRAGGETFTHGNGAGNDIRYQSAMSLVRDANGMYFTGSNPWTSWVKFESEQFTRGAGTTVEWIFRVDGAAMVGISGLTTSETSTSQWQQGAVMAYLQGATQQWGYYGSSPSSGSTWSLSDSVTFTSGAILKLKIENDGSNGQNLTLYQLPSADPSDWDDESTVLNTSVSTNNNTETTLVPFLIPRDSANNYFVALKVD